MTTAKTALMLLVVFAAAFSSVGCSVLNYDRRDAPWDPRPGQNLHDQIPAWDGAALRVCGGHLTEEERRRTGRSARC